MPISPRQRAVMIGETETFLGHIDGLEHRGDGGWVLVGWAQDQANPDKLLDVEVVDGSRVMAVGRTGSFREDVKNAGFGDGCCGLSIPLPPESLDGRQEYDLSLRVAGTGISITPPISIRKSGFLGHVDGYDDGVLRGWAVNVADATTPAAIDILVDGKFAARVTADQPREDVAQHHGTALCGFEWVVPREIADGAPRRLAARISNTSTLLPGASTEINLTPRSGPKIHGLSEIPSSLREERRYRAYIDQHYRASRLVIEAITADAAIYGGHAAHEFEHLLVQQFPHAYLGSLNRILTNPSNGVDEGLAILNILHMDVTGFAGRCLSGAGDSFFSERIQREQPTILVVEAPDNAGGLGSLDLGTAKQWCTKIMQSARERRMEVLLENTVIDFFFGHPGFVLGFKPA
jgi:hypothetical protein